MQVVGPMSYIKATRGGARVKKVSDDLYMSVILSVKKDTGVQLGGQFVSKRERKTWG